MSQGQIKILVGAGLDRSVEATFGSIAKTAERTGRQVAKAMGVASSGNNSGAALGKSMRNAGTEAEKGARQAERAWNRELADLNRVARAQDRIWEKQARERARLAQQSEREQEKVLRQETRNAEREANKRERVEQRAAAKIDAERQRFASRASGRAVKFLVPPPTGALSAARNIASDFARGAGVDFNLGSSVSRAVGLSSRITQLQNQASLNNQEVSHAKFETSVKGAADKYGFDRGETAEALGKFMDKTGDATLGIQVLGKMAERAAAGGGSIDDMMDAAGDVAMNLGPVKDKAGALTEVMDAMTVQGAKGAMEMKNLAAGGMSRLASNAGRFEGDERTNMKKLGALAQIARQSGGAASASEAANSVARLTDSFATPARIRTFKRYGIEVFSKSEKGQLHDPIATIKEALVKTNGNPEKMKELFPSSIGAKPVLALTKAYNQAGGGKKGSDAVDKLVGSFMETADIQKKLDEANKRRDEEAATKAQKFQNQLDEVVSKLATEVLPAFEKVEPSVLKLVDVFGKIVEFAATNPVGAILSAIGLAIARASLESTFRSAIEKALLGGPGGGLAGIGTGCERAPRSADRR